MKTPFFILIGISIAAGLHADDGFQRYQMILEKQPFGQDPPGMDVVQIPITQSFARTLRLSMMFEGPEGDIRVGITDVEKKKDYVLRMGQEVDGLELVDADLGASEAMVRRDNEVALFKLAAADPTPIPKSEQTRRKTSYQERRNERAQTTPTATQPEPPKEPALTGDALRKHLENVQMDAIRNGLPPLPLPLTPEMDAQLVSEGILPPQ